MNLLQNLIVLYVGAVVLNLGLAAALWTRDRTALHRSHLLVWAATLLSGIAQGIVTEGSHLAICLGFSTALLVNVVLARFVGGVVALTINARPYLWIGGVAVALTTVSHFTIGVFFTTALPVALAAAIPLVHTAIRILRERRSELTTASTGLLVFIILMALHNLDFTVLRDKPAMAPIGFTIVLFILFGLSTTTHAAVVEREARRRSAIEELDRFKSRFFANITHELRTPLTMVLAPIEMMLEGETGELTDEQQRLMHSMQDQGLKLLKSINDLLDLSKMEDGRFELDLSTVELSDLVESVATQATPLAGRKNVRLSTSITKENSQIVGDTKQLERVVVNLISNAIKFTEPGGEVSLSLEARDAAMVLEVKDSGCGIDKAQLATIFERFAQADHRVQRRYGGSGIGLAFVREIVALHSGIVSVDSVIGEGTTFKVSFPTGTDHLTAEQIQRWKEAEQEEPPSLVGGAFTQHLLERVDYRLMDVASASDRRRVPRNDEETSSTSRILIVDDNLDVLRFVQTVIGGRYQCYVAENGRQGLETARARFPDLIITDYQMPEMDGIEMLRELRADDATKQIPIIMLSARQSVDARVAAFGVGADVYLRKPFSPRELRAAIMQLLAKSARAVDTVANAQVESLTSIAAGLAHEINNPLSYLRNSLVVIREVADRFAEALEQRKELDPAALAKSRTRIERMAGTADRGITRIAGVVDLLRKYSREGYPHQEKQINFDEAVRAILEVVGPRDGSDKRLETSLEGAQAQVACVPEELHQALGNLVQNAFDAATSVVEVVTRYEDGKVLFQITDDGPGIPKEIATQIFTPFFSTKGPGGGMGIGLSITRQVITRAGGTITTQNVDGKGARFNVALPVLSRTSAALRQSS